MSSGKIFEGKTTNEAIEKGLKELGITKDEAEIKVLESEDKRSFFSILTPRVVKVEITSKKEKIQKNKPKNIEVVKDIDFSKPISNLEEFLNNWIKTIPSETVSYTITKDDDYLKVQIDGEDLNYLIGYRGDVLNQLQVILSQIAGKDSECKIKVILNICEYKEKREKALQELAQKLEKTVSKTKKTITLEPMTAYERKIIHSILQNSKKVKTSSIGEEPYRKVVVSVK